MTAFEDWFNWAIGSGEAERAGWRSVADNAARDARYALPDEKGAFQEDIGRSAPSSEDDFNASCRSHHLKGETVNASLMPPCLTRLVDKDHLDHALAMMMGDEASPGGETSRIGTKTWVLCSELLSSREYAGDSLFFPARILDDLKPESRAVFVTFQEGDSLSGALRNCGFLDEIRLRRPPGDKDADYAVHLLATDARSVDPPGVKEKILLFYPRHRAGECRFPVPADAGWHPRFRAVTLSYGLKFGRTFPDGAREFDHEKGTCGEHEVVHPNHGIPAREVSMISLGPTTCR